MTRIVAYALFFIAAGMSTLNLYRINLLQQKLDTVQTATAVQSSLAKKNTSSTSAPKSQDQILTAVVAKNSPAVVSIVISKDVPDLSVTYVNPFGDDPSFEDFGIKIPVYEQKGTKLQRVGAGSGFLISHNGHILTNKHVVSDTDAEYTALLSDGSQKNARVVYRDSGKDVAILKIDGTYSQIATLGDSSTARLGQTVVAIGNALGEYSNSVSVGIISGMDRTIEATNTDGSKEMLSGVFQTDAAINPGNSGGPLVDLNGNVIGINVATLLGGSNISFSIPVNAIKSSVSDFIE